MIALAAIGVFALATIGAGVIVARRDDRRDASPCRRPLHRKCVLCGGA